MNSVFETRRAKADDHGAHAAERRATAEKWQALAAHFNGSSCFYLGHGNMYQDLAARLNGSYCRVSLPWYYVICSA